MGFGFAHAAARVLPTRPTVVMSVAFGVFLFFRVATEARFATYLWGLRGVAVGTLRLEFGPKVGGYMDRAFSTDAGVYAVLVVLALASLSLIFGVQTRIWSFRTME